MWDLWIKRFISYLKKRNYAERTIKDYPQQLAFFFRYLDEEGIKKISWITREVIRDYQTHLYYCERYKGGKLSFNTQHTRLAVVRTFFMFLMKEDYLPYDPTSGLEMPKRKKNLPDGIMSTREVFKILKAATGNAPLTLRDRAILEILYSTGIRNSELRNLSIYDVDLAQQQLRVKLGKGGKERLVPLGTHPAEHLGRYLKKGRHRLESEDSGNLLFVSVSGRQISCSNLAWIVKKYVKKAKIDKPITPHCFRHTFASHMLKGRADLRHLQELLGHSSVHTTQIYTKVELSNLKEVHKRCHPRGKMGSTR